MVVPRMVESQMAKAFLTEKYMAEKQDFLYMAPNLNWPNFNRLNERRAKRTWASAHSDHPPKSATRSDNLLVLYVIFIRPALYYLFLFNHFIYFLAKFDHSDIPLLQLFVQLEFGHFFRPIWIRPLALLPKFWLNIEALVL